MGATELVGRAVGTALAPLTAAGSFIRHARVLHPNGVVYRAEVTPLAVAGGAREVAERLAGPALVRLSSAWWKNDKEWRDVLGIAVRFRGSPSISPLPDPGDQDLLFATIRWWWTTPLAPLATNTHSFLWNDYHAVSPFEVRGFGRAKIRLVSPHLKSGGRSRYEALEDAVRKDAAVFQLQARPMRLGGRFQPIATLRLVEEVSIDQERLRFSPFRTGRGVEPRGVVNWIRRATYGASQLARPAA